MKKYIIREIAPEACDFSYYFDDGLTEKSGDYANNLFIVCNNGHSRISGFNIDEYKRIQEKAKNLLDGFSDVEDGLISYDGHRYTYKDIMQECNIPYSSAMCHRLKVWAENADIDDVESIAEFLSIIRNEKWSVKSVCGYCQGDYCEVLTCEDRYSNPRQYGEIYLGCGKEFCVIDLDDDGEEKDRCYGFIVADCEVREEEDYKRIVSEWACIPMEETTLEMIESSHIQTVYTYKSI